MQLKQSDVNRLKLVQAQLESALKQVKIMQENIGVGESPTDNVIIIIDAGHGGNDAQGNYTTPPNIGKKYKFLPQEEEIREGVVNREIAKKFSELLEANGIEHHFVSHEYLDNSMQDRVKQANQINASNPGKTCLYMSFHSNAHGMENEGAGTEARGFSIFTSPNTTNSDKFAQIWFDEHKKLAGDSISYREDLTDGDSDFDANFFVLINTSMTAVLVENLFFTNYEDAKLLLSPNYQWLSAKAALNAVLAHAQTL